LEGFRVTDKQRRQRKVKLGTQCTQCGAQHGNMVYRSKTRPGKWTDEIDTVIEWPCEWSHEPKNVMLHSESLLCSFCRAHPELAA